MRQLAADGQVSMAQKGRGMITATRIATGVVVLLLASVSVADTWTDTGRQQCGLSRVTRNDDNAAWMPGGVCPGKSDDGKYCADIVRVALDIDRDHLEIYRYQYHTLDECRKYIQVASGPNGWFSLDACNFDAALRHVEFIFRAWTGPQQFRACAKIEERQHGP
jgi:hypothetical protein